MNILDLFEGKTELDHQRWNEFLVDQDKSKNKLLWYPSSGNDYMDIINFSRERNRYIDSNDLPNLFIHNDYDRSRFHNINCTNSYTTTLFHDDKINVKVINKIDLRFNLKAKGNYKVRQEYVVFYEARFRTPHIYFLNLKIESSEFGKIFANVLYFGFENINLFEFFISNSIKIDFLVKVREGCGMGGNRMSVTQVYFLLSKLNLKYLVCDNEIHWNQQVINMLIEMSSKMPKPYTLTEVHRFDNWSDFTVLVNKLNYTNSDNIDFTIERIRENFDSDIYFGIE